MRRGDIYLVEMDPVRDGELGKRRPCAIVSDDAYNRLAPTVLVMPITTYSPALHAPPVRATRATGLDRDSSLLPLHIRAVAKSRLISRIGRVPKRTLDAAIDILLLIVQG